MANVINWFTETGKYMVRTHPDLYDLEGAVEELSRSLDTLREANWDNGTLVLGPYMMYRSVQDGVEEVFLSLLTSSLILFEQEGICRAYAWRDGIELDDPLDDSLDME